MARISSNLNSCLKELAGLIASDSLARYESEVPLRRWKDELGRLRVWAANIGAHQVGQSSLDYRLRDASHIKDQTVKLLERMRQLLDDLKEVMSEDASEDEHEDIHAGDHDWDDDNVTEIQQIYHNVVEINDHLFKMTMAIRRPARHDQLLGMERSDATSFEPWAQQHVSNKYPHADAFLVNRIASSMARQRATLKYRERHRAKLSQGIDAILSAQPSPAAEALSETIATEFHGGTISEFQETASDSGVSQTSYAPTLLDGQDTSIIPPPPKPLLTKNPSNAHTVSSSLRSRTTTLGPVTSSYESHREWRHHLEDAHSLEYGPEDESVCPLCQDEIRPATNFDRHVGRHLEELALFVLPRTDSDDYSSVIGNDEGASLIRFFSGMTINLGPRPRLARARNSDDPEAEVPDNATGENPSDARIARVRVKGLEEQEEQELGKVGEAQYTFLNAQTRAAMAAMIEAIAQGKSAPDVAHIAFDAAGNHGWMDWDFCKKWEKMERFIRKLFEEDDVLGPLVAQGHYDMVGPDGSVIDPQDWDRVIQPGWIVAMRMRPIPEKPKTLPATGGIEE